LTDIKVVGKPLVRAKASDVDRLEAQYWIRFPKGYRDYVTRLGEGVLGGTFVRIYPPWRIASELSEWRERIRRYWFWDRGKKLLPKDRALECIIVGDTMEGDELVFHPSKPGALFVLPRHSEKIFDAGADLLAAVDWMCSSGKLTTAFKERNFEPFDSRKEKRSAGAGGDAGVPDPPGESFGDILAAAQRWAKRHELLERARQNVQLPLLKNLPRKQLQITPQRQSLLFVPGEYEIDGVVVTFKVEDTKTGLELGSSEIVNREDYWSSEFKPNPSGWARLKSLYEASPSGEEITGAVQIDEERGDSEAVND
jgi:hypothetical protein